MLLLMAPASLESMPTESSAVRVLGDSACLSGRAGASGGFGGFLGSGFGCGGERLLGRAPAAFLQ